MKELEDKNIHYKHLLSRNLKTCALWSQQILIEHICEKQRLREREGEESGQEDRETLSPLKVMDSASF